MAGLQQGVILRQESLHQHYNCSHHRQQHCYLILLQFPSHRWCSTSSCSSRRNTPFHWSSPPPPPPPTFLLHFTVDFVPSPNPADLTYTPAQEPTVVHELVNARKEEQQQQNGEQFLHRPRGWLACCLCVVAGRQIRRERDWRRWGRAGVMGNRQTRQDDDGGGREGGPPGRPAGRPGLVTGASSRRDCFIPQQCGAVTGGTSLCTGLFQKKNPPNKRLETL